MARPTPQQQHQQAMELARAIDAELETVIRVLDPAPPAGDLADRAPLRERLGDGAEAPGEILVALLMGPSGAGKSTLFRLLSGVTVPVGWERPTTRHPVAAAKASDPAALAATLFPRWHVQALPQDPRAPAQVTADPGPLLFAAPADPGAEAFAGGGCPLLLVDSPDFDTVCESNREQADRLAARAEVVFFVVYPESYKQEVAVTRLRTMLRRSARLALVYNKVESREQAEALHRDLRAYFRETGLEDGEESDAVAAYYCPRSSRTEALRPEPLEEGTPGFASLLHGEDAWRLLTRSLVRDLDAAGRLLARLTSEARSQRAAAEGEVARAETLLAERARAIAGSEFPIGRFHDLIKDHVLAVRWRILRWVAAPMGWVRSAAGQALVHWRAFVRGEKERLQPREQLERTRLAEVAEELVDRWRRDYPGIEASQGRRVLDAFHDQPLPEPGSSWEASVRTSLDTWMQENRWKTRVLGNLNEVLTVTGGGAVVLDLAVTGGQGSLWGGVLLSHLGIVGAAGAGCAGAGLLLGLYERFGMRRIIEQADRRWREMRENELHRHLREHLAGPLFLHRIDERLQRGRDFDPETSGALLQRLDPFLDHEARLKR
ncbi:MAG: hypothetical protein EA425_08470 [Puniceicoccaceae bacterium]|nr:MAG: hypothetical protein EA425_08470 [Puniceicoccaceae bacterium]